MGDDSFCGLCLNGDIQGVQAAIDNGADVNEEDDLFGKTGLMCIAVTTAKNGGRREDVSF